MPHDQHRHQRIPAITRNEDIAYEWESRVEDIKIEQAKYIAEQDKLANRMQIIDMMMSLIRQIKVGMLSAQGAAFKILRLIEIINYFELDNDPEILMMYDKLIAAFRLKYERKLPSIMDMMNMSMFSDRKAKKGQIDMYRDMILDGDLDPKYTDRVASSQADNFMLQFERAMANPKNFNNEYDQSNDYLHQIAIKKAMKEQDPEKLLKNSKNYSLNGKNMRPSKTDKEKNALDFLL
ncbi:MAG: hypothetical protein O3A01_05990 [bacterium]|nr:hypothetical protein [bacterium]